MLLNLHPSCLPTEKLASNFKVEIKIIFDPLCADANLGLIKKSLSTIHTPCKLFIPFMEAKNINVDEIFS